MSDIFFDKETHTYLVDGTTTPSVTDILAPLHRSYAAVNPSVLEYAANRGMAVHEACEAIDYDLEPEIYPEIEGYVRAYMDFLNVYRPEWQYIEHIVYNEQYGYIGTLDRAGWLNNGKFAVVDIKTSQPTKEALVSVCLQTAAYAKALGITATERYGLFLKADGSYRWVDCIAYQAKYKFTSWDSFLYLLETRQMVDRLLATGKDRK